MSDKKPSGKQCQNCGASLNYYETCFSVVVSNGMNGVIISCCSLTCLEEILKGYEK